MSPAFFSFVFWFVVYIFRMHSGPISLLLSVDQKETKKKKKEEKLEFLCIQLT